jgi:hypothetical protein
VSNCAEIYAGRNRKKVRRPFWTFEAAWNLAATESKRKWRVENASLYVSTALCNQLKRDGHNVRQLIKEAKERSTTCTGVGAHKG